MSDPKLRYKTLDITKVHKPGLHMVRFDTWFFCENGDPTKAVFYITSDRSLVPQSNSDPSILHAFKAPYEGCEPVHMDVAYYPYKP